MVKGIDIMISSQEPEVSLGFGVQEIACILTFLLYSNTSALAVLNQILCCVQHFCRLHCPSRPFITAFNEFTPNENKNPNLLDFGCMIIHIQKHLIHLLRQSQFRSYDNCMESSRINENDEWTKMGS